MRTLPLIPLALLNGVWQQNAAVQAAAIRQPQLTIPTTSGEVTGFINTTTPNVRQFLSIPYAQPPTGTLRFQPPVRMTSAAAPIHATSLPPNCMQFSFPGGGDGGGGGGGGDSVYGPGFTIAGAVSEDCLYLNVYTPSLAGADADARLPVIIWLYGGAFIGGGSDVPYQIPDRWVERTKGHVVVTLNYRLNAFGFPNARAQPLNVGLMDRRMAVEWARDNIAAFGGDTSRMVLWGQSAGAASVGLYGYAHPTDPIVAGLIADSGAASMLLSRDPEHSMFTTLASRVGCADLGPEDELACVQGVGADEITSAVGAVGGLFVPGPDNLTAFEDTVGMVGRGEVADIPLITGSNLNEGTAFGNSSIGNDGISCAVSQEVATRVKYGYKTYRYLYSGNFSNITPLAWAGATHSAELPLVFGTHEKYNGPSTSFEWDVSNTMQDLWLAFASNVNTDPTSGSIVWPQFDPSMDSMASFASDEKPFQLVSGGIIDSQCA